MSWIYTPTGPRLARAATAPLSLILPYTMHRNTPTSEELKPSSAAPELATLIRAMDPLDPANSVPQAPPPAEESRGGGGPRHAKVGRRRGAEVEAGGCGCSEAGGARGRLRVLGGQRHANPGVTDGEGADRAAAARQDQVAQGRGWGGRADRAAARQGQAARG